MQVRLARKYGFCFGVEDAIETAQRALNANEPGKIVALGPVIHNRQVVENLERAGLDQSGDLDQLEEGTTVLIRSHGVGPDVYAQAEQRKINIVDATCVLVKRAQSVVRQLHEEGYRVVMIGDNNHPEVQGVIGYAPDVIVIDKGDDLDAKLPLRAKLGIVAQTTHAPEHVANMIGLIARRPFRELKVVNTLCLEVVRRQEAAVELAREVDVMFILGGLHSANTQELARLCREEGVATYHLETWAAFEPTMVRGAQVAGIAAGASTPDFVVNEFADKLHSIEPAPRA